MLLKCDCFASLRSRSENVFHKPIESRAINGFSILLNQPMNRVSNWRGMRLVSRKFRSSCSSRRSRQRVRGGAVSGISLYCAGFRRELEFKPDTEWGIPPRYRNCSARIAGDPGTEFDIIEYRDAQG